mmetsp:Transcript_48811/g.105778  ORF Transcript_48811/g.105778 Transcript_48811/m.105778 type:complete len:227 (+) Transcript_48811:256-936(+)
MVKVSHGAQARNDRGCSLEPVRLGYNAKQSKCRSTRCKGNGVRDRRQQSREQKCRSWRMSEGRKEKAREKEETRKEQWEQAEVARKQMLIGRKTDQRGEANEKKMGSREPGGEACAGERIRCALSDLITRGGRGAPPCRARRRRCCRRRRARRASHSPQRPLCPLCHQQPRRPHRPIWLRCPTRRRAAARRASRALRARSRPLAPVRQPRHWPRRLRLEARAGPRA